MPIVIKGCPRDKWEEVQAIQHEPFVYIMSNGSKWAGEEEDDVETLLNVLATYRLDYERFSNSGPFYSADPCTWAHNPEWNWENNVPKYIDGPRLYACDGVVRFFGNFLAVSHVFNIDTNDKPTIDALIAAIDANALIPETTEV